jgi:hypothetical protein
MRCNRLSPQPTPSIRERAAQAAVSFGAGPGPYSKETRGELGATPRAGPARVADEAEGSCTTGSPDGGGEGGRVRKLVHHGLVRVGEGGRVRRLVHHGLAEGGEGGRDRRLVHHGLAGGVATNSGRVCDCALCAIAGALVARRM